MIYDYVVTKPPMEEIIEHGWAKDASTKVHKYIDRWRGKAGKWYYKYKSSDTGKAVQRTTGYLKGKYFKLKAKHKQKIKDEQQAEWDKKGRKKSYKKRREQISAARTNAKNNGKRNNQYYTSTGRREQISSARKKTKVANRRGVNLIG